MKKLYAIIGMAGALAAPSVHAGFDGVVTMSPVGPTTYGGGLFQAATTQNGTFDTFCISIETTFSYGNYNYVMSSQVAAYDQPPALTYIAEGTAYIYRQFLSGNTTFGAGYGQGGATGATVDAVQEAIWYLQGDLINGYVDPENSVDFTANVQSILSQIPASLGSLTAQEPSSGAGNFGVYAMNMYAIGSQPPGQSQPQLYGSPVQPNGGYAPVPEPTTILAGALMLLPFGASTIRILRKKSAV